MSGKIIIIILALTVHAGIALSAPLYLNTAFPPPVSTLFEQLVQETFRRNGLEVVVESMPAERSMFQANKGMQDGEGPRIAGISDKYPNLVLVPEKILDIEIAAFSKDISLKISGWESLKPHRVGFIRGWKILETNVSSRRVEVADDLQTLFRILENDRIDIALIDAVTGLHIVGHQHMDDIYMITPPLITIETFLYLHKKHEALVPRISSTLRDMKKDGTYDRILKPFMAAHK